MHFNDCSQTGTNITALNSLSPGSRCMPLDATEILESFKKKKKRLILFFLEPDIFYLCFHIILPI